MAFAGVDLEKSISDAGIEGKGAAEVDPAAPAPAAEAAPANDAGASELERLAGTEEPATPEARAAEAAKIEEFLDFEANKGKKIKIGDQELTLEELNKGYLRQQDFTQKTQELAKDRKYRDNLEYDLQKIAGDPTLLSEFKRLYPKQYHAAAELVVQGKAPADATKDVPKAAPIDPELKARLDRLESAEKQRETENREREIKAFESEIDATMKELAPKYPFADDETVMAKAQGLLSYMRSKAIERGDDPSAIKLTKSHWDRVYKLTHEQSEKRYKAHYEAQRQKQKSAHAQGSDVAAGGGLPGQAPSKMKLGDVKEHMIAQLEKGAGAP